QRRQKTLAALAAIPPAVIAEANRARARRQLAEIAAEVARRHGCPDIGTFVRTRLAAGASLATISQQAGLHRDWLSRHLADLDPAAAAAAREQRPSRWDAAWWPAVTRLGFPDVRSYLNDRHLARHWTVNAIAAEVGVSHHAVESSLRRHQLPRMAHAAKRHAASERAASVAASLGASSIAGYVADRRAAGWTWRAMSAETGQPPFWLRRHGRDTGQRAGGNRTSRPAPGIG
ncbi:MAG TPA: hypothetical protein VIX86_08380, partial [Streptosporangiaceae bacterium]